MIKYNKLAVAISAAVLSSTVSAAVLEEVTVTATKRAVSARDIPINISAVTGDTLTSLGIEDITDLAKMAPGLVVSDQGIRSGFMSSNVQIRGMNAEAAARPSGAIKTASPIALYVNNTPLVVNLQFNDIERVEILRGPQGTLYGSSSMGGTIRYITAKPDFDELSGSVTAGIGSIDGAGDLNHKMSAILNVPVSDTFALRFNAATSQNAGYVDVPGALVLDANGAPATNGTNLHGAPITKSLTETNEERSEAYRVAARWEPSDTLSMGLEYIHQDLNSDNSSAESLFLPQGNRQSPSGKLNPYSGDTDMVALEMEADIGFATASFSTSYTDDKNSLENDNTGLYQHFSFYTDVYGSSPRPFIPVYEIKDTRTVAHELRLASNEEGTLEWIVGAFYMQENLETKSEQFYPGYDDYANECFGVYGYGSTECGLGTTFFLGTDPETGLTITKDLAYLSNFQQEFTDKALFGELTVNISDEWQATVGARAFDQEIKIAEQGGVMFAAGYGGLASETATISDKDQLFKFNTSYQFNDDNQVSFTWSEGFRRGGGNALPSTLSFVPGPIEVVPEVYKQYKSDFVTNWEIGVKGLLNDQLEYTVSAFLMEWENAQVNTTCTSIALFCAVNAGDAENVGLEMELKAQLTDDLLISAGYTYIDSKLTSVNPALMGTSIGDRLTEQALGQALSNVPENSATVTLVYDAVMSNGLNLGMNLSASHVDDRLNALIGDSRVTLDAYTKVDAGISLSTTDEWRVALQVSNLFSADDYIGTVEEGTFGANLGGVGTDAQGVTLAPRTVSLTGTYQF